MACGWPFVLHGTAIRHMALHGCDQKRKPPFEKAVFFSGLNSGRLVEIEFLVFFPATWAIVIVAIRSLDPAISLCYGQKVVAVYSPGCDILAGKVRESEEGATAITINED